ncbi:MAG: glycine dehydrogenase, partial [Devosia sp.]
MRYLPHSDHERADMLGVIGAANIDALFSAVPKNALKSFDLGLPAHSPEFMVEAHMRALAGKN